MIKECQIVHRRLRSGWVRHLVLPLLMVVLSLGAGLEQTVAAAPAAGMANKPTLTPKTDGKRESFISGKVFEDEDDDGVRDEREDGKRDVTVTLRLNSGDADRRRTKTDRDGEYKFTGLAAGTYLVTIDEPDGYEATTSPELEVRVDGQNGTRLAHFGLAGNRASATPTPRARSSSDSPPNSSGPRGGSASTPTPPRPATPETAEPPPSLGEESTVAVEPPSSAHFLLQGRSDDNGLVAEFVAEGHMRQPGDLQMFLDRNGDQMEILLAGQKSYRRDAWEDLWHPTSLDELRTWHGVLLALDMMRLSRLKEQVLSVRRGEWQDFDGRLVEPYEIELGPPLSRTAGAARPEQLQMMGGIIHVWLSAGDQFIQLMHLQLIVPSSRSELVGRVEPAALDAWLRFSQHDAAFTIHPPQNVAQPAAPAPPAPAPVAPPVRAAPPVPAPPVRAAPPALPMPPAAAPAPILLPDPPADAPPSEPVAEPTAAPAAEGGPERSESAAAAAAERALLALASGLGPRGGAEVGPDRVVLPVPWRSQLPSPSGATPPGDGSASLGMILEAFGVLVQTGDLEALARRWQQPRSSADPVQLDTLLRIAERGSVRPPGPPRGLEGGAWTAELARDYLRRGYPVLARIRPEIQAAAPQPSPTHPATFPGLEEQFADNRHNWPDTPRSTAWLDDGAYHLWARQSGQFVAVAAPIAEPLRDVIVSGSFRKIAGPEGGSYGLIVRDDRVGPRDGVGQTGRFYLLAVGDRGEVGVWRRDGDRWTDLLPWTPSEAVGRGHAANELTVRAIGQQLTFVVNGIEVAGIQDATLAEGGVGVFVGGDFNDVLLDRFAVQSPDAPARDVPAAAPTRTIDPDRFIVLIGFEGDQLLYLDPAAPDGAPRRIDGAQLDQAWTAAMPSRQGAALGFGTNVIGLLDVSPRQVGAPATAAPSATPRPAAPTPMPQVEMPIVPAEQSRSVGGFHPMLLGFLSILFAGIGFVLARLFR